MDRNLIKIKHMPFNLLKSEFVILQSASELQTDSEDWSAKNANFATLIGCHGNVP